MSELRDVFVCDAVRTPIGRYGGALAKVRTDDLAAIPIRALLARNRKLDPAAIEEVVLGCANQAGEVELAIAGGVESMTRAPLVMGKAAEAFQRSAELQDTTIGWRFINPLLKAQYGVDAMPETA